MVIPVEDIHQKPPVFPLKILPHFSWVVYLYIHTLLVNKGRKGRGKGYNIINIDLLLCHFWSPHLLKPPMKYLEVSLQTTLFHMDPTKVILWPFLLSIHVGITLPYHPILVGIPLWNPYNYLGVKTTWFFWMHWYETPHP